MRATAHAALVLRTTQAVARKYSATLSGVARPSGAELRVRGRPVALEVAIIAREARGARAAGRAAPPTGKVRLREDRVAMRVLQQLEDALNPLLAQCRRRNRADTIVLTLGAPIRLASKLVAALTETLGEQLASGAAGIDHSNTVLGNRVRYRLLKAGSRWAPQLFGFVFSGDPDPAALARMLGSLRDAVAKPGGGRALKPLVGERWLALVIDPAIADGKTCQRILGKLAVPPNYQRILMVAVGGRVEVLAQRR